jgi:phage terminase large subunit GpA-like protein
MREIMDSISDPRIKRVVFMKSAQVAGTEFILNVIGFHIHYDPSPILVIQPNVKPMAEDFSKDRLAPMLRDTPVLRERIADAKSRDSGNTILHKLFPGGHLTIVGANAPSGLASRPIRIILADEVDRYPASAGTEGDPLSLAHKRTTTFWNRKEIYVSTPGDKETSRIEPAYMEGTREEWNYACPGCGEFQPLKWGQIRFEDVTHECLWCKDRFDEFAWKSVARKWISLNESDGETRSFHINELSSPFKRWSEIIKEFHEAKRAGKDSLKVWVNTSLGETWEEQGDTLDAELFAKRRETYDCELPDGVLVITAGVDVQDDRLEVEVVGWGVGKESWGIQYKAFQGDPAVLSSGDAARPSCWEQLDMFLQRSFDYADGSQLQTACVCIDSGGHFTTEVYEFCVKREHRRIFAIKGVGGDGIPLLGRPSRSNRKKCALFPVGANTAKETLFSRLKTEYEGPNYCHFPREAERGYNEGYFKGLAAEKRVIRYYKGRPRVEWSQRSGSRNEPIDMRNYATAALEILNPNMDALSQIPRSASKKPIIFANNTKKRRVVSSGVS